MEAAQHPRNPRRGRPPDDISRVRLFIALAAEYESLVEELPAPSSFTFGTPRDSGDRWSRLVRAFALRKFTIQPSDHVYLGTVAASVNRMLPEPEPGLDFGDDQLRRALRESQTIHVGGDAINPDSVVEDLLYGIYLHGDFDRWQRRASELPLVDEYSLYVYTVRSTELVGNLAASIANWATRGALPGSALPGPRSIPPMP